MRISSLEPDGAMPEQNVIPSSASESPAAVPAAREPFVAPQVEDMGGLTTLTLLGGSL